MRTDRLPTENRRSQGIARRRWYETHNPEHLAAIERMIRRALRLTGPVASRSAIILGSGACTELPLELLARECAEVVLVDLDTSGMTTAQAALPMPLRQRVRTTTFDLTGDVSARLASLLAEQPWRDLLTLGDRAVLDAAAQCLTSCEVPDPPSVPATISGPFQLVISSLVVTQLFNLPLLDVADTLTQVAPHVVPYRYTHEQFSHATDDFKRRVAQAHLDLIESLLDPSGVGVLVSDVSGVVTSPARGHGDPHHETLHVLPAHVLDFRRDLSARFDILDGPQRWRWVVTVPERSAPGQSYDVNGVVFRSRPPTEVG